MEIIVINEIITFVIISYCLIKGVMCDKVRRLQAGSG